MPLPSGFKTKEEYAAYMREYRARKKEEREERLRLGLQRVYMFEVID